jgi:hypothetical protein
MPDSRRYIDHRPYPDPPDRLTDLTGPTTGTVEVPVSIDWGPPRAYDVATEIDRRILYERVLREASSTAEVCRYVNGPALVALWSQLWLPQRLRLQWETRFPELHQAA